MPINLTKIGGLVDIVGYGTTEYIVDASSTRPSFKLFGTSNEMVLSTALGVIQIPFASVTDFSIAGVPVTDLADFKTQLAIVFPNTNGGSGGSETFDQVLANGSTLTEDREIDNAGFGLSIINGPVKLERVIGLGDTPTIEEGDGAGTDADLSIEGTDLAGYITVETGTAPAGSNLTVASIIYSTPFVDSMPVIIISAANEVTAALSGATQVYADSGDATRWYLVSGSSALADATQYKWAYMVLGRVSVI